MKSILISIQPYYAYLEMKGIKTVEMRKTEPKDKEWSRKVKVYVSHNEKSFKRIPKEDREWFTQYVGKVAFEFVCEKVDKIGSDWIRHYGEMPLIIYYKNVEYQEICKNACLGYGEMYKYSNDKDLLALHITDLKIYDKPKELGEITTYTTRHRYTTKKAKEFTGDGINIEKLMHGNRVEARIITKPPQSWQYIQELED